ncbi:hypothetical protein PF006_g29491 [Phytophthora fragariae]|uniref:Uncharacterized protein n=1 Tax=Phytophthora fragariae TaxID=53985 RepID=A0A6A3Q6C8_9STRA|nr:hypothetical protein PF006_g29491 [Phytophthora fragariae]
MVLALRRWATSRVSASSVLRVATWPISCWTSARTSRRSTRWEAAELPSHARRAILPTRWSAHRSTSKSWPTSTTPCTLGSSTTRRRTWTPSPSSTRTFGTAPHCL